MASPNLTNDTECPSAVSGGVNLGEHCAAMEVPETTEAKHRGYLGSPGDSNKKEMSVTTGSKVMVWTRPCPDTPSASIVRGWPTFGEF